jgi:ribosome recycling factor
MEEINFYLDSTKESMEKAIQHTSAELVKIRAGKATPEMMDGITVDYYGSPTPLNQTASVTTPDARTIMIKPWEKSILGAIERAIINSDLGLNPQNDGEQIRLNIPPLTEERRRQLAKQAKAEVENGKISVRNIRKDSNEALRKLQKEGASEDDVKRAEDKVQQLTDTFTQRLDELFTKKESEIMTV